MHLMEKPKTGFGVLSVLATDSLALIRLSSRLARRLSQLGSSGLVYAHWPLGLVDE